MFNRNLTSARGVGQGSRYQPKAHQKFRRSHDWQYAAGAIGHRKWRVIQARLKILARALATFDRSGDCLAIYPATRTILRCIRELETNHAADTGEKARTWSLRTLFVYLDLLNKGGIETKTGCAFNRKPRIRSLHPEALLSVPATHKHARRESCTRSRAESCTRAPANPAHKESIRELQTSAPPAGLGESFEGIVVERSKSSSEVSAAPEPDDDSNESLSLQDENEGDKQSRFRQIAKLKFHQETQNRYDDDVLTMILNDAMLRMEAKPISSPNYFVTVLRNGVLDSERMEEHYYFLSQHSSNRVPTQRKTTVQSPERESFSGRRQRKSAGNGHRRESGRLPPVPGKQYPKPVRIDASEPKSPIDDFYGRGRRFGSDGLPVVEVLPTVQPRDEKHPNPEPWETLFEEIFGRIVNSSSSTMISDADKEQRERAILDRLKEKHPEPEPRKYCYSCGSTSGTCGCRKAEA